MLSRLDYYLGSYLTFSTLALLFYLVALYSGVELIAEQRILFDPFLVQLILLDVAVFLMVARYVVIAASVNEEYGNHREYVSLNEMKASSLWLSLLDTQRLLESNRTVAKDNGREIKELEMRKWELSEAMKAMKRMNEAITISNEQNPLRVLGIYADYTMLISMFGALLTLISSGISYSVRSDVDN